jgi:hypothetical protein
MCTSDRGSVYLVVAFTVLAALATVLTCLTYGLSPVPTFASACTLADTPTYTLLKAGTLATTVIYGTAALFNFVLALLSTSAWGVVCGIFFIWPAWGVWLGSVVSNIVIFIYLAFVTAADTAACAAPFPTLFTLSYLTLALFVLATAAALVPVCSVGKKGSLWPHPGEHWPAPICR